MKVVLGPAARQAFDDALDADDRTRFEVMAKALGALQQFAETGIGPMTAVLMHSGPNADAMHLADAVSGLLLSSPRCWGRPKHGEDRDEEEKLYGIYEDGVDFQAWPYGARGELQFCGLLNADYLGLDIDAPRYTRQLHRQMCPHTWWLGGFRRPFRYIESVRWFDGSPNGWLLTLAGAPRLELLFASFGADFRLRRSLFAQR